VCREGTEDEHKNHALHKDKVWTYSIRKKKRPVPAIDTIPPRLFHFFSLNPHHFIELERIREHKNHALHKDKVWTNYDRSGT
jgi:hypothetical protein